jgi:hypothetical protein
MINSRTPSRYHHICTRTPFNSSTLFHVSAYCEYHAPRSIPQRSPSSHLPTPLSFLLPSLVSPGVKSSALNTRTAGTTASASILPPLLLLVGCCKFIAAFTSLLFTTSFLIRGHSSLSLELEADAEYACEDIDGGQGKEEIEEDRRCRNGDKEDRVRLRSLLSDFDSSDGRGAEDDVVLDDGGGMGMEGNGILISVYSGPS